MKILLALSAVCLIVACGADAPGESTPGASPPAPADADPAAAVAAQNEAEPTPAEDPALDENPLISLLEQDIAYGEGSAGNLVGFLAVPEDAAEPLPGIIVLHEWWGLNEGIREAARRLSRERYIVLAADLYGGRTADTDEQARALMRELVADPAAVRDNIRQAYEYLERYALAPRIGAVGWDLGGRWSLQTAIMLPEQLDALVMFYGTVETDQAVLSTLDMPILGLFGEQDASIPVRGVQEFRIALQRLGKSAEVRIYAGVDHGFFFSDSPTYSPIAADDAWNRTIALLESALKY